MVETGLQNIQNIDHAATAPAATAVSISSTVAYMNRYTLSSTLGLL